MKNLGMFFSGRKGAPSLAAHFYVQAPWGMLSTHGRWGGPPQLNFSGGVNNAMFPYLIGAIIGIVIGLAVGVPVGIQQRKKSAEREIGSAEDEAKRIINAGVARVVIRNTQREYSVVRVEDWIQEDDSLPRQV